MVSVCPWCREPLSFRQRRDPSCPHCQRPLTAADGQKVRPVDLCAEEVEASQKERFRDLLLYGSIVVAAVSLVMPLLHVGVAAVIPFVVVAHMIAVRLFLIRGARRLLGTTRRIFNRWISRFSFLWLGIPGYGLTVVPVAGVVAGVATFVGLTALVHFYTLWSLHQERERRPLALWEKAVLAAFVVLTLLLLVCGAGLALLLGYSLTKLGEVIHLQP